jgi:hypothetical protein
MKVISVRTSDMSYRYTLELAGAVCEITTNSDCLGDTLRAWRKDTAGGHPNAFTMQVVVTGTGVDETRQAHFRGLHHVVIASFGSSNVFIFDLLRRNIVATVSEGTARDSLFWNEVLLPIAMGVLGAAVGVVPVHCACLAAGDGGLLIGGASGAGKSTLSAALGQDGLDFISDDWTYLSCEPEGLVAHGLSTPVKLLPDAIQHFPALAEYPVRPSLNGELAYEVPAVALGAEVRVSCRPRWFLFLERTTADGCHLSPILSEDARRYVESGVEQLPSQLTAVAERRSGIIQQVSRLSCWTLRYGGPPRVAVESIQEFLAHQMQEVRV